MLKVLMKKILLIEDDFITRKIWQTVISKVIPVASVEVHPSVDSFYGKNGKTNIDFTQFDLIVVDVFLAGDITGIEFVSTLSSDVQKKTIISSTISGSKYKNLLQETKFSVRFLPKPVRVDAIIKLLETEFISEKKIVLLK